MAVLSAYRTDVHNLLATAVDAKNWPLEIIDQALRLALDNFNPRLAYESDFTVSSTGYTQDLSTITDILQIIALAYPWVDGGDFGKLLVEWRLSGLHSAYFTGVQPTSAQKIRVRHTKSHKIQSLDSAASTTVPTACEKWIGYGAAAWACVLRQRQIVEDPTLAKEPAEQLAAVAAMFRTQFKELMAQLPAVGGEQWGHG